MDARALAAVFWLSIPLAAGAQRITGTIHETASGLAVSGAVVSILDSAGRASGRTISDERGHYGILWRDNSARIRVVRLGFGPVTVTLPKGPARDTTIDLVMEQLPVTLEAVRVSTNSICSGAGEKGAALDLWDQVRAALLNSIVARTAMPAAVYNLNYQRILDPNSERVVRQTSQLSSGTSTRPFASAVSAEALSTKGYASGSGAQMVFYAPDADVLFDDTFTEAHCFGVRGGDDTHQGLVGLTFEPRIRGRRDVPFDVRGTLWVDLQRTALVELDFKYTGVDPVADRAGMGGTIHFQTLKNGVIFIDRWSLRLIALQKTFTNTYLVSNIGESGGVVLAALWPDSTRWVGKRGAVQGAVTEKGTHRVVPHAVVSLDGVDTTITNLAGGYGFDYLPPGLYSIKAVDTTFQKYHRERAVSGEAKVGRGDTATVNFEVPSSAALLADMCVDEHPEPGTATILARITDGSRQAPSTVNIQSTWVGQILNRSGGASIFTDRKQFTNVDDDGRFHVCGVARERLVRIKAFVGRLPIADTTMIIYDSVARALNWVLPPATFAMVQGDASALTGRVLHGGDGKPIPDADVWVLSSDVHTRTDSAGQFRLYGLQPGRQFVEVKRLGFTERRDTVTLKGGQEVAHDFSLEGNLTLLDTVRTTSPIVAYHKPMLQQFEMRRHTGVGRYLPEELLRKNDNLSVSLFLAGRVGGIKLVGYKSSIFAESIRNAAGLGPKPRAIPNDGASPTGCWVSVYIDGAPMYTGVPGSNAPDLATYRVEEFAGVEFYAGGASVPAQFGNTRETNCGVLLLWTRDRLSP